MPGDAGSILLLCSGGRWDQDVYKRQGVLCRAIFFHKHLRFFHLQLRGGDGQLKSAVGTEDGAAAGECVLLCAAAGILLLHQRAEQCGSESRCV